MIRLFARPIPLVLLLASMTLIPVMIASIRVAQIPMGLLPEESLRLSVVPFAHWMHSLAGGTVRLFGANAVRAGIARAIWCAPSRGGQDLCCRGYGHGAVGAWITAAGREYRHAAAGYRADHFQRCAGRNTSARFERGPRGQSGHASIIHDPRLCRRNGRGDCRAGDASDVPDHRRTFVRGIV